MVVCAYDTTEKVKLWWVASSLKDSSKIVIGILDQTTERLIACHDAVWNNVIGIHRSFLEAFMTCGPIGLSCDLKALSPWAKDNIRNFIAKAKEDKNYLVNGKDLISGAEIAREGILVDIPDRFEMFCVTLEETE